MTIDSGVMGPQDHSGDPHANQGVAGEPEILETASTEAGQLLGVTVFDPVLVEESVKALQEAVAQPGVEAMFDTAHFNGWSPAELASGFLELLVYVHEESIPDFHRLVVENLL